MIYTNGSNLLAFVLFADDTNVFCSNENVEVLQDTLNRELAKPLYCSRLMLNRLRGRVIKGVEHLDHV